MIVATPVLHDGASTEEDPVLKVQDVTTQEMRRLRAAMKILCQAAIHPAAIANFSRIPVAAYI